MGIRTEVYFDIDKVPTSLNFAERLKIALKEKNWANFGPILKKIEILQKNWQSQVLIPGPFTLKSTA